MDIDREQFLEDGFLIVRQVIPAEQLETLRAAYELLVERQKVVWARQRGPDDPPGGAWETGAQPRLSVHSMGDQIDAGAAPAVEIWCHGNTQGVSSRLLGVEDAGVTEMMLMCSPVRDHGTGGHRGWHRDFYPPHTAPLQGYTDDIIENGPRYVQWNLALYDDDVLWVVPGSHKRLNTAAENAQLERDDKVPLPGAQQVRLQAGDGAVYILPILHWGSLYNAVMRRTIHGGFSLYTDYEDLRFLPHIAPAARADFERWRQRSQVSLGLIERALRAVLERDGAAYLAALENLQPGCGPMGRRLSTIYLSKAALRVQQLHSPDFARLSATQKSWALGIHPPTLSWGRPLAERFSVPEAEGLWQGFKSVDEAMRASQEQWAPGFQGGQTRYYLNEVPADFSAEGFVAGW